MKKRSTEFKETEIGIIPEDWECKKIAETSDNDDVVQTGPFGSILHARDYADEGIPLLLVKNVADGILKDQDMPKVNFEKANELKKFWLQEGDIVFTRVGAVGRTFYVAKDYEGWMFSGQTLRIRIQNDQVNNRFVEYFFRTPQFQGVSEATALGTTRPSINTSILANTCVPLPHKAEQDKIVKILFSFDEKLRINRLINNTLEKMGQALFKHWFINFEFPNEKGKPYKSSGGEMVDSELGEIPKGWNIKKIGEVLELEYGKALKETVRHEGSTPVYGSNGQVGWHNKPLVDGPGIVVGRKGNPGTVIWVQTPFYPIDTTFYVVPKSLVRSMYYLFYALKTQDLPSLSADSAVPGLNRNIAYMNDILVPPSEVLEIFDTQIGALFEKIRANESESSLLSDIRDNLIPRLMSGKIRVNLGWNS
jgi:type I restriction enzyme S subunit